MALFDMDVGDMPEFKNPDPGEYDAIITKAELTETKKNKDPMIVLTARINSDDPDVNGTSYKYYHVLPVKKSDFYQMQLKSTRALCENLGIDGNPEVDDFENVECRILLEITSNDNGEFANIKRILAA